ncbi:MAG: hypothetical protein JWO95_2495, partial [Verrucomicrobiales bacterium]|nr:hypothetical protein [Verrucomicrobiales bacterium]
MFSGTSPNRFHWVLSYFVTLAFVSLICSSALAKPDTDGLPQVGEAAITRTTADINAASAASDVDTKVHGKKIRNFPRKIRVEVPAPNTQMTNSELPAPSFQLNPNIATPSVNFTGGTVNDCTGYPPDTMGAVGPTQFIVALNGRIRSFNKTTGAKDNAIDANTDVFFLPVMTAPTANNFTTDPRIRYDRLSKRWFIIMIDVPGQSGSLPNRIMLAVSDGSVITPSTVWSFFQFLGDSSNFADYPSLGIDANALYIGCNMFSPNGSFANCNAYVVRKSSLLSGGPIVVTTFANLVTGNGFKKAGPYTPQGVDNFNAAATEGYFIGVDFTSSTLLQLRRISNPGGTPSISGNINVSVSSFASPIAPTVKGSTNTIDGLDERLLAAHLRNGTLWTTHNVGVNSAGGTSSVDRNGVRWYQITNIATGSTPSVVQSGTVFDSSAAMLNYWMGTIMVSGQGHAAMGFTIGGPNHYMDAAATGRYATDTSGAMQAPFTYTASSAPYNPNDLSVATDPHRWGDYSMTTLDPNDDMTMWTVQEWVSFSQNGFAVQVAKLPAPAPATPASCNPSAIPIGITTNIIVTGSSVSGSGFYDPGTGFSNRIAATINGGSVTVNSITYTDPTHITLNVTVASNAT